MALGKPCLWLDLDALSVADASARALLWVSRHRIQTLKVAGPRASEDPEGYAATLGLMRTILARVSPPDPPR